jgi:hypothetical protein
MESILYKVFSVIFQKNYHPNDGFGERHTFKVILYENDHNRFTNSQTFFKNNHMLFLI